MFNMHNHFYFQDQASMLNFGHQFALACQMYLNETAEGSLVIYLNGELGAGKTTLSRSIVQAFGYTGNVKSPTYTLVEEYTLPPVTIYHFDLYRLASPEELEFMGIRDYFRPQTLCLLEWAKRGRGIIPEADILLNITYAAQGRELELVVKTEQGQNIVAKIHEKQTA